jgi:hypothetical protein
MERNRGRKEKKKKRKRVIFNQPGLEVPVLGLNLEAPSVPVGISNRD